MKWYPLAHLAAVTMSSSSQSFKHCSCCFRTPLVRLLGLCVHSCYTSFNFRTRDVGASRVRIGREWSNLGGLAPRHTQRPPTYGDPFFTRPCQKKIDTVFITPAAAEENI